MNVEQIRTFLAGLGLIALLLAVVHSAALAAAPDSAKIVIKDFMFSPTSLTIKAGSTVVWTNTDEEPHTVVSNTGLFRSAAVDTNETFSFKFDKPGSYNFVCSIHPRMSGTIVVE